MKKKISFDETIQKAVTYQNKGETEKALSCLKKGLKNGLSRKKITMGLVEQILSTISDVEVEGNRPHLPKVIEHLSKSAQQVLERIHRLAHTLPADHELSDEILLLNSELSILHHEITISMQRSQFESRPASEQLDESTLASMNQSWLENITSRATSQLGQDLWVLERNSYMRGGFFVEFGATNGVLLSNSYLLEKEFGWNGICSEPNPEFLKSLKKNRLCIVSNECIGPTTGEEVEFVFADVFGGMVANLDEDDHKEKRDAYQASGATGRLKTISLNDFLLKHNAPKWIDYLSIDTEGSEFAILETFPFSEWDVRHITVEHNETPQRELIYDLLSSHGFQRKKAQWDDWYFKD